MATTTPPASADEPVEPAADVTPEAPAPAEPTAEAPAPVEAPADAPEPAAQEAPAPPAEPAAANPYAPPPAAPTAGPAYGGAPAAPKQTLSIVSLVTGISGVVLSFFFGLGLFPAIAGVVTGHMALKREPHARGLALGGLITSYVGLALSILIGLLLLIPVLFFFIGLGALGTAGSF